jgi:hypothetical protein
MATRLRLISPVLITKLSHCNKMWASWRNISVCYPFGEKRRVMLKSEKKKVIGTYIHHQPINVLTARAQAFLMDYTQGERAITHLAGPERVSGCQQLQMQPGPKAIRNAEELEIINFRSPIQRCLISAIALTARPSSSSCYSMLL